jgi:hypothetical protein
MAVGTVQSRVLRFVLWLWPLHSVFELRADCLWNAARTWLPERIWLRRLSVALRNNRQRRYGSNCILTNVMHKFLIYLSVYFCLTCFGLSFSTSSEAGVQFRQWFKFPVYGVCLLAGIELNCCWVWCVLTGRHRAELLLGMVCAYWPG